MTGVMHDKAIQDIVALPENLISVWATLHGCHLWWLRVQDIVTVHLG